MYRLTLGGRSAINNPVYVPEHMVVVEHIKIRPHLAPVFKLESKHKKLITIRLSGGPVPFNPEVVDPVIIEDVAADHSVLAHNNPLVCELEKIL